MGLRNWWRVRRYRKRLEAATQRPTSYEALFQGIDLEPVYLPPKDFALIDWMAEGFNLLNEADGDSFARWVRKTAIEGDPIYWLSRRKRP